MATSTFTLTGLTCGHCVNAITEEINELDGIQAVNIDLVSGGESTLTVESEAALTATELEPAIKEAGDNYSISE